MRADSGCRATDDDGTTTPHGWHFWGPCVCCVCARIVTTRRYCDYGWEEGECGYGCSDHASWDEFGFPASFPIERSGTVDPRTGEPCRGHTDDDRLECVDLTHAFDYTKLALSYLIELSFTLVGA